MCVNICTYFCAGSCFLLAFLRGRICSRAMLFPVILVVTFPVAERQKHMTQINIARSLCSICDTFHVARSRGKQHLMIPERLHVQCAEIQREAKLKISNLGNNYDWYVIKKLYKKKILFIYELFLFNNYAFLSHNYLVCHN